MCGRSTLPWALWPLKFSEPDWLDQKENGAWDGRTFIFHPRCQVRHVCWAKCTFNYFRFQQKTERVNFWNLFNLLCAVHLRPNYLAKIGIFYHLLMITWSIFIYSLKGKDAVFSRFIEFKHLAKYQTGWQIKCIAATKVANTWTKHSKSSLKPKQLTIPYTPQQNGVAERANRNLVEMSRCL